MVWKFKTCVLPMVAVAIGSFAAGFNCATDAIGIANVYLASLALMLLEAAR